MTLIAVQIALPAIPGGSDSHDASVLFQHLGDIEGAFIGFFVAFVVLARYWITNHSFFDALAAIDAGMVVRQIAYLMVVVLLPFAAKLVGEYEENPGAVVVFAVLLALLSNLETVLLRHAAKARLFRRHQPNATELRWATISSSAPVITFLGTLPLAWIDTSFAMVSWIVVGPSIGFLVTRLAPDGALAWTKHLT